MRPLTDHTPKPLLMAGNQPLVVHHLQRLKKAGYDDIVINTHHLGHLIEAALGDGSGWNVNVVYSREQPVALETAGGIAHALPLLEGPLFLVINGDIWCEHSLTPPSIPSDTLAHLVLVPNPPHHPLGDFSLSEGHLGNPDIDQPAYTFSGIGWYRPELFSQMTTGPHPLAPLLREAIARGKVTGELYLGPWQDIGTPERLQALNDILDPS
ncbi:unnamed protein product [Cyprideis torosa]|uniref:Nucleotidyl transferase domain-containing protein n=1 Tax=Cyprideis torosa TaxID=163714 RepID=A0A7R8ZX84_9CRUS|nr:unnamed protein product [Cyprideis torosa]CAG0909949.1 unnamed protein product [Cyprideis torosa]